MTTTDLAPIDFTTIDFTGPATRLNDAAIATAARRIGCAPAAVRAVIAVESRGGGFLRDRRPKILFERHVFSRLTKRRHDAAAPDISSRTPGGYRGGVAEYPRLARAIALDPAAALRAASWGMFQIMGENHRACGFADVGAFVRAMVSGEPAQLDAFVAFIASARLTGALVRQDWAAFARGYNGPAYARNAYDTKLAAAYRRYAG